MPTSPPPSPAASGRGRLLPILGVGFGLAVIVGNTIGAGILRAPGSVAANLPDVWLFLAAWAAGGLYALLGAIQLSELGATISRSGCPFLRCFFATFAPASRILWACSSRKVRELRLICS